MTPLVAYPAWAFLIAGGATSAFAISPGWDRAAAYLVALGPLLLIVDFARRIMARW